MGKIPYLIEKYDIREFDKRDFHMKMMNQSMAHPYELKQIVPVVSSGETESVYCVYAVNHNLIETLLSEHGQYVDSKYLTGEQIGVLKNIGIVEVHGENKKIEEISIKWDADSVYGIRAEIKIK